MIMATAFEILQFIAVLFALVMIAVGVMVMLLVIRESWREMTRRKEAHHEQA